MWNTNSSDGIQLRLREIDGVFERTVREITKDQRDSRQRRWRNPKCVAELDALGHEIAMGTRRMACIPVRRNAIRELSFQNILGAARDLLAWHGFDILHRI